MRRQQVEDAARSEGAHLEGSFDRSRVRGLMEVAVRHGAGLGRGSTADEIADYTRRPVVTHDKPLAIHGRILHEDIPADKRERFWGETPAPLIRSITEDFLTRLADSIPSDPLERFAGLTAQIVARQPDIGPAALYDEIKALTPPSPDGTTYSFGENRFVDAAVGTAYDHSVAYFSGEAAQQASAPVETA